MSTPDKKGATAGVLGSVLLCVGLVGLLLGERVLGEQRMLGTGLGLLAIAAAVIVRVIQWRTASGDARAVEARLVGAYGGVLVALGLYGLSTEAGLRWLDPSGDETRAKLATLLMLAFLAVLLVSMSAVLFIELAYQSMPIAASVELRRVRVSLHAGLSLALSIVFLLAINYVATARDVRKDVSYFRASEPSGATLAMLRKLDEPLRVTLFFRPGSDVVSALQPYFEALKASKKITLEARDIALAPKLAEKHKVNENGFVLLVTGKGEEEKGETLRIGTELTEARPTLRKLDAAFQRTFTKLARPERSLWLTVGHGERNAKATGGSAADGTSLMIDLLKRLNLKVETLGLAQGLGMGLSKRVNAIAIVGPTEKFLPEEVDVLKNYVRVGGRIFLMLDPDLDVGLGPLLESLNLKVLPGVVNSQTQHMVARHNDSDRAVVFTNLYTSHPSVTTVTRNQKELATVFYQGAALVKADAGATHKVEAVELTKPRVTFPLRTTVSFFRDLNANFTVDPGEKQEVLTMMAAVTMPVAPEQKDPEGRAIVIGDGDFITDKLAPNAGNHLLFVDALAWLVGNEELSGEVNSEEDVPIEHSREEDKLWFYGTTFAMPIPVALLGLWITRRRRRASENQS